VRRFKHEEEKRKEDEMKSVFDILEADADAHSDGRSVARSDGVSDFKYHRSGDHGTLSSSAAFFGSKYKQAGESAFGKLASSPRTAQINTTAWGQKADYFRAADSIRRADYASAGKYHVPGIVEDPYFTKFSGEKFSGAYAKTSPAKWDIEGRKNNPYLGQTNVYARVAGHEVMRVHSSAPCSRTTSAKPSDIGVGNTDSFGDYFGDNHDATIAPQISPTQQVSPTHHTTYVNGGGYPGVGEAMLGVDGAGMNAR
jgi:hypothetical protein